MIEIGDEVKIVKVCKFLNDEEEKDQYGRYHNVVAVVKIIADDNKQPYYVEFKTQPRALGRKGLWCSYVEKVFDRIILPKELFEI